MGSPTRAGESGSAAQILDSHGRVLDSAPGLGHGALLTGRQITAALRAPVHSGGRALLASRLKGENNDVLVVGVLLGQRNHALTVLGDLLFIGGPLMLLLACAAAYWLSARALAPVERMRRRAAEISGGE